MAINLTDSLNAATTKGKLGVAEQIYLDGDIKNLQQAYEENEDHLSILDGRSSQMEEAIKEIAVTGGASTANAVTYDNTDSTLNAVTAQGAIDELDARTADIKQETGDSTTAPMSQAAVTRELQALGFSDDHPEFIRVYKDSNDRILWGIQSNGNVFYGAGVPDQIRTKIDALGSKLTNLISESSSTLSDEINTISGEIDILNDMVENLQDDIATINSNILAINEEITDIKEITSLFERTEHPEYIQIIKDSEGRILEAIRNDGTKVVFNIEGNEAYFNSLGLGGFPFMSYEDHPEFVAMMVDSNKRILIGVRKDGTVYIPQIDSASVDSSLELLKEQIEEKINTDIQSITDQINLLIWINDILSLTEHPEFIDMKTDSNGRILESINKEGRKYFHSLEVEEFSNKNSGEDIDLDSLETLELTEHPEFIMIKKDANGRILDSINKEGKRFIHNLTTDEFEAKKVTPEELVLPEANIEEIKENTLSDAEYISDLEKALKNAGLTGGTGDWSEATSIEFPEPRLGIVNISGVTAMPTTKTQNLHAYFEFWDMQGNYFKKKVILNAQGSSSLGFIKKNFACDFCEDDWIGDDTFSMRIGDWVLQDSFHFKAFYTDFFRGISIISYKLADEVDRSRGIFADRPWKKALVNFDGVGTNQVTSKQISDFSLRQDTGAKCHPDGFPVIVHLNGDFYGIFVWCLKKHRDNMHQEKDVAEHIHLDGTLSYDYLWGGNVKWTAFEIRNPKNLYTMNGGKYDGDNPTEIAGETEVSQWITAGQLPDGTTVSSKIKTRLQTTAKVKQYVLNLASRIPAIRAASTNDAKKAILEQYFDVDNLIDYEVVNMFTRDGDGFSKNWQWTTYDGIKWWVNEYDKDMSFGGNFTGQYTLPAPTTGGWINNTPNHPVGLMPILYSNECKQRWKDMVSAGILTPDNAMAKVTDWISRIGYNNFELEWKKWPESPCNRDRGFNSDYWVIKSFLYGDKWSATTTYSAGTEVVRFNTMYESLVSSNVGNDPSTDDGTHWVKRSWDSTVSYSIDDEAYYGSGNGYALVKATSSSTNQPPFTKTYAHNPQTLGYYDSLWRLRKYMEATFEVVNNFVNN